MPDIDIEIVVIGNEILLGDVLDSNSHWLCTQLTGLGATVQRVTQIRDERLVIAKAVGSALGRGADLVITVGGLGPTDDDMTLAAVAQALGRPMERHPEAYRWVSEKYGELAQAGHVESAEMTPSREKMAHLPQGAEPLENPVGAAPGVLVRERTYSVVSLPGVPDEMKGIFEGALRPTLNDLIGQGAYQQWKVRADIGDESALAPLLEEVNADHPQVYCKSRARRFGSDVQFVITLSARGETTEGVQSLLEDAWRALQSRLADAGIDAERMENE